MEQILLANTSSRPRFLEIPRRWIEWARTRRQLRREAKQLAKLPDHLLRDIGREDLIVTQITPWPQSH